MAVKTVPCHCVRKWRVFANLVTYEYINTHLNASSGKIQIL